MATVELLGCLVYCYPDCIRYEGSDQARLYTSPQSFIPRLLYNTFAALEKSSIPQISMFNIKMVFNLKFSFYDILGIGEYPATYPSQPSYNYSL